MVTKCSELTEVQDNCKLFLTTEQTVDKITSRGICSEKKGVFFFFFISVVIQPPKKKQLKVPLVMLEQCS